MTDAFDLDHAVRVMTAWIRDTDSFTQVVARWMKSPVEYTLLSQKRRQVSAKDAVVPGRSSSAAALHRHGLLQAALPCTPMVLANVRAILAEQRLTWHARQALKSGVLPLGTVRGRYEVRRHTQRVTRTSAVDEYGTQVLRVRATLITAGRLVAVVDESVYQRLLDHRRALPAS